ncbi:hypothetical protein GCM10023310_50730 [Paenibacillus vulneris]|uniref:Bacteriophage SP-beta YorD domain-containing protein n=1 Tax=Paenibacillus vulneris TaxID=1133364 RepID=A0ABW3UK39_9BACL
MKKEAIIVDINGYFKDVTLVAADVTGVFPIYKQPELVNSVDDHTAGELTEQSDLEVIGYTVAISVPVGLYKPRFDLVAWEQSKQSTGTEGDGESKLIQTLTFWVEGITPEELAAIRNQQPSETDTEKITRLEAEKEDLKARLGDMELVMAEILTERGK